jgi:nucleoside 2-deoxyribosyltransferase
MYKKLIYLASPYSAPTKEQMLQRTKDVQVATAKLIEQGHLIFSPIVHTQPIEDIVSFSPVNTEGEMSGWMKYDFAMIDKCDEVWVLKIDGWEASRGVAAEIQYARHTRKLVRSVLWPSLTVALEEICLTA